MDLSSWFTNQLNAGAEGFIGDVTLLWLVSKTFQHTAEHTHDVMRMALFWDAYARHEQEHKEKE